jgi:hypothetical protein
MEHAVWTAVRRGEATLAVVDEAGRFRGFVPPHRLVAVLLEEHEEDMARIGGFLQDASSARLASRERILRRYWHRLPWLLIGLAGALLASVIVGSFERQLSANVMIAYFIPGIVSMADAVGTQTETLVVGGLSAGVSIRKVVRRRAAHRAARRRHAGRSVPPGCALVVGRSRTGAGDVDRPVVRVLDRHDRRDVPPVADPSPRLGSGVRDRGRWPR